jgi:hypothetical protein
MLPSHMRIGAVLANTWWSQGPALSPAFDVLHVSAFPSHSAACV